MEKENRIYKQRNRFREQVNNVEKTTNIEVDREIYLALKNTYDVGFIAGLEYLQEIKENKDKKDLIEDVLYHLSNEYQNVTYHADDKLKLLLNLLAK